MKQNHIISQIGIFLFLLVCAPLWSQTTLVEATITDGGKPVPANTVVTLTNLGTNRTYKNKTDKNGKFSSVGVAIGNYEVEVTSPSGEKLFKQKLTIQPADQGASAEIKLDIGQSDQGGGGSQAQQGGQSNQQQGGQTAEGASGAATQQPKYTKEQIEEIKKQNAKAESFNALIKQVNDAMTSKSYQDAISPLEQLIASDPTNWQYYSGLGDAQLNLTHYPEAVDAYEKGIQAADSNTTVDPKNPATDPARKKAAVGHMLTSEGNAYLKQGKNKEAVEAYTKAASLDPNPGVAYFNLCATQYNTGNTEGALEACDKAITADPNKADAYFIKGSLLMASAKQDKDGKIIAPPGTAEALNKYLQLAPNGGHAKDVTDMLGYIGSKVETTYKKGK